MKKIKKIIIIILLIGLALFAAFFYGKKQMKSEMEPEITSSLIYNKLVSAKELTTLKYHYTNMGHFENQNTFYGYKVPFTSKEFIVSYEGLINAGIDLNKMKVNVGDKSIEVRIPAAEILSHEIYEDSLKVYDERESIFNRIDIEDYNDFSKDQKSEIEKKAIKKGLLKEADEESKRAIEEILMGDTILSKYDIKIIRDENLK
ncbi:MAG: DUF4230 domain-containing protein [Peptoniphilus harei]|uniref:DUF4230 domain-containing protein n=1 Tax=Peptoniphilus harei TaxID=54005 RepID=UPI00290EAF89|nr:DUF4230 domain-containing protein [Peptoniphilus harei]MDU5471533.1 DUF4230 domain-containing protein [Peptoniphilus harei]MDU6098845.1 DUF4230 domain-containing protein [Peptoniphilus harei]